MPLFEYHCKDCGLRFEELKNAKDSEESIPCVSCNGQADKLVSSFAPVIAGGSSNETVDMTIGRAANNRWQSYTDRQSKRHTGKELKTFDLPKAPDGKFMPVMALGDKKSVENRKDYVGALQDHRKKRVEKGIPQFNSAGEF